MQYSPLRRPGGRDGGDFLCRCSERAKFISKTGRAESSEKVSGTNQNIRFVKFTFTDCLVEFSLWKISTLISKTPGNRFSFTSWKIKVQKVRSQKQKGTIKADCHLVFLSVSTHYHPRTVKIATVCCSSAIIPHSRVALQSFICSEVWICLWFSQESCCVLTTAFLITVPSTALRSNFLYIYLSIYTHIYG